MRNPDRGEQPDLPGEMPGLFLYTRHWRGISGSVVVSRLLQPPQPTPCMAHIFLAIFLLVFGLNILLGTGAIPLWIMGGLAIIAGALLLLERFGFGGARK